MVFIVVAAWVVLLSVPLRFPKRSGAQVVGKVDMAVVLDVAAAALLSGSSLPDTLRMLGKSLGGSKVGAGGYSADKLHETANMLVMGATWDEAWRDVEGFELLARTLQPAWVDGVAQCHC